jgi:hypothetical protein
VFWVSRKRRDCIMTDPNRRHDSSRNAGKYISRGKTTTIVCAMAVPASLL